jgi:hypothetical protein
MKKGAFPLSTFLKKALRDRLKKFSGRDGGLSQL